MRGRVLLIDDSPLSLADVRETLLGAGWEVESAPQAIRGISIARKWNPETVVCDLHMPVMGGLEFLRLVRELDDTIPVIVLTGDSDLSAVLNAVRVGAFDYVLKVRDDPRPLLTAVERAVEHCRLARENRTLTYVLQRTNAELQERIRELDDHHRLLEEEKKKSESLLLNILPRPVANRLKDSPQSIADAFAEVTVLFADIVGFTQMAADRSPQEIVGILNAVFSEFDSLADKYGLEKIKTIGDSYMAAAGMPDPRPDHAEAVAEMALSIREAIRKWSLWKGQPMSLRIGINTGPVVAGVIGQKKFIYDLWGDTVNIASRMESQGLPDCIQVTEETYRRLKSKFEFAKRGTVDVRGRGSMVTYLLQDWK